MTCLSQGAPNDAQAENDFEEHYIGDYYSESHHTLGQWVGKGAMDLGLVGEVSREHFAALLEGTHPHTTAVLVPLATQFCTSRGPGFSLQCAQVIQALVGWERARGGSQPGGRARAQRG
jgi:conjugative relaxase-like TrwC/TraI family protein